MSPAALILTIGLLAWLPAAPAQDENVTTGTKEETAAEKKLSPLDKRLEIERKAVDNPFVLTSHRPTYLLPIALNTNPNDAAVSDTGDHLDHTEIKFQISLKFSVWRDIFGRNDGNLFLAYTQQAYWQAYNRDLSSPFRETDHEPEAFLTFNKDFSLLGFRNRLVILGFDHQSNGRTEDFSRSWNRIYANFILERRNLVVSVKPWYRLPESGGDDDNPDIEDYLGHGELTLIYETNKHVFSVMTRNNFQGNNRGAVQIDWSYPLKDQIKGYVQYFNGYGESLIDYNHLSNRFGVGIMLNNWF